MYAIPHEVNTYDAHGELTRMRPWDLSASAGTPVTGYFDLQRKVAMVASRNPRYFLLYRGQRKDHRWPYRKTPFSSLFASIYRPEVAGHPLLGASTPRRWEVLDQIVEIVRTFKSRSFGNVKAYREAVWALIQHYEIALTPLLDLTTSLRVATAFAFFPGYHTEGDDTYLYVFGLPNPYAGMSFCSDDHLSVVRLQSVVPGEVLRPHLQQAYLSGHFPESRRKNRHVNASGRLLAKFVLRRASFMEKLDSWKVPFRDLYPSDDEFLGFLEDNRSTIEKRGGSFQQLDWARAR